MVSASRSIYLADPESIDIITLYEIPTVSFPALGLTHSCRAFIDPLNLCGSSHNLAKLTYIHALCVVPHSLLPTVHRSTQYVCFIITGYPHTIFLPASSINYNIIRIPFRHHAPCGRMMRMGCSPSSFPISPHGDWVDLQIHSEAVKQRLWRRTGRPYRCEVGDLLGRR